ncbi:MAG: hypothetical protein QNL33_14825 [Akkermansiaceae bacterium]|jgi:hypothetical protein
MKRFLKFLMVAVVLGLLAWAGFVLLRPDSAQLVAEDQVVVMQEALASLEKFTEGGSSEDVVNSLEAFTQRIVELNVRRGKLGEKGGETSQELLTQIESLGGELVSESLKVEMSDDAKAPEVAAAFEKFSAQ